MTKKTDTECVAPWQATQYTVWPAKTDNVCVQCGQGSFIELGGADAPTAYHPNLDIRPLPGVDLVIDFEKDAFPFHDNHADRIKMEHLLNHLTYMTAKKVLKECLRIIKPGGMLYIMVSDVEFLCKRILEDGLRECWANEIWGTAGNTYDADFHYWGYTAESLKDLLLEIGFAEVKHDGYFNAWEFRIHAIK